MEKQRIFLDTEFHEHRKPVKFLGIIVKKVWTIDLISIGLVKENGESYYAINRDLNLKYAKKNKWLKDNVLDKLPDKQPLYPPHGSPRIWQESMRWLPMNQIRQEIIQFCGGVPDSDEGGSFYSYPNGRPEFYGYYGDYDWVVFAWIFGTMMQLPNGFPMYLKDLKQMLDEEVGKLKNKDFFDKFHLEEEMTLEEKLREIIKHNDYPKQENEHKAVDDAKWNLKLYKFIQELKDSSN